jgi:hypothetical protein
MMGENRLAETKLREQQERAAARRAPQPSGHLVWKILGGAALAIVATGLITSLHDIRRYIRISTM